MKRLMSAVGLAALACAAALALALAAGARMTTALLMYVSPHDGDSDIYLMDTGRELSVNLTRNRAEDDWPVWSPDGGRIAFVSNRAGDYGIYVMGSSGSAPARIGEATTKGSLSWSPDGSALVFTDYADYGLKIIDVDTGEIEDRFFRVASAIEPVWSPDGTQIAFVSLRDRNAEVYVVDANGGEARNLSRNRGADDDPAWSPDGRWLAFQTERTGFQQIYLAEVSSGAVRGLTEDSGSDEGFAWSADGARVVVSRSARFAGVNQLLVVDIATGEAEAVYTSRSRLRSPVWSADGRYIAFIAAIDNGMDMFRLELETGALRRLTYNRTAEARLGWQP